MSARNQVLVPGVETGAAPGYPNPGWALGGFCSSQSCPAPPPGAAGGVTMAQDSKARLIPLFPCQPEALGVLGGTAGDTQVTLCVEQAGWMPGLSADKQPPPSGAAFWF